MVGMLRFLQDSYNQGIIGRLLGNRFIKWVLRISIFLFILDIGLSALEVFGIINMESEYPDFSTTNPYRDLPDDPACHRAIREVLFIGDTLRDGMLPTSLPDDDYDLYSNLLRSLETRQDITWLVMQETKIDQTMMAIANRGGSRLSLIPDEPHNLHARAKALHGHWWNLIIAPEHPERWEARFDTVLVAPLLEAKTLGDGADSAEPFALILTPEQEEEASEKYATYRSQRDWKVSYLKRHPPAPMAWSPIPEEQRELKSAWQSIFEDGVVEAGRQIMTSKLVKNPKFKPMYRDLITERVPFSWVDPDSTAVERTDEERAEESRSLMASMEKLDARRKKQDAFQKELAAQMDKKQSIKEEL